MNRSAIQTYKRISHPNALKTETDFGTNSVHLFCCSVSMLVQHVNKRPLPVCFIFSDHALLLF